MKIFISHSSKDKSIALAFSQFLESIDTTVQVFCSSDTGSIRAGSNFANEISKALNNCDVFIPLISSNYYNSRFCMIELGFAYAILFREQCVRECNYIFPVAIPPVHNGSALYGTPLSFLQVVSIHNANELRQLLDGIYYASNQYLKSGINGKINEFVETIKSCIFNSECVHTRSFQLVCKSQNVPGEDGDYLSFSKLPDGSGYEVVFNAKPFGGDGVYPEFLSFVYKYVDKLDLLTTENLFRNPRLKFTIDNTTSSLSKIDVEIKHSDNNAILWRQTYLLSNGLNNIQIPLTQMKSEALRQVSEICFVLKPSAYVKDKGIIRIHDFCVSGDDGISLS